MSETNPEYTHIELTYFKRGGKYYSSDEIDLPKCMFHEAIREVEKLLNNGKWPGLTDGQHDFCVYIRVFTEFGPLSWLFIR